MSSVTEDICSNGALLSCRKNDAMSLQLKYPKSAYESGAIETLGWSRWKESVYSSSQLTK